MCVDVVNSVKKRAIFKRVSVNCAAKKFLIALNAHRMEPLAPNALLDMKPRMSIMTVQLLIPFVSQLIHLRPKIAL